MSETPLNEADMDLVEIVCECGNVCDIPRDACFGLENMYCGQCRLPGRWSVREKNDASGYAYKDEHGTLHVRTITETPRGAKVNAIASVFLMWVSHSYSDDKIDRMFERHCPEGGKIVPVKVTES